MFWMPKEQPTTCANPNCAAPPPLRFHRLKDGWQSRCAECRCAASLADYYKNREKRLATRMAHYEAHRDDNVKKMRVYRASHLEEERIRARRRLYGLTKATFEQMLNDQRGLCAIGGEPLPAVPDVEHNHITGAVRSLVCGRHNRMIGFARDDPRELELGIAYLIRAGGAVI